MATQFKRKTLKTVPLSFCSESLRWLSFVLTQCRLILPVLIAEHLIVKKVQIQSSRQRRELPYHVRAGMPPRDHLAEYLETVRTVTAPRNIQ